MVIVSVIYDFRGEVFFPFIEQFEGNNSPLLTGRREK
jgi:hypothetical protein